MACPRLLLTTGPQYGCGAPQDGVLQLLSLIFRIYASSRGNPTVQNTAAATVRQVRLHPVSVKANASRCLICLCNLFTGTVYRKHTNSWGRTPAGGCAGVRPLHCKAEIGSSRGRGLSTDWLPTRSGLLRHQGRIGRGRSAGEHPPGDLPCASDCHGQPWRARAAGWARGHGHGQQPGGPRAGGGAAGSAAGHRGVDRG